MQPRSQGPLLLGPRGHGGRVGEDPGNEVEFSEVKRLKFVFAGNLAAVRFIGVSAGRELTV